ncbi:DUF4124 domain-containing protein [Stenotrophomonas sp.]|uniref:DUF4124 domain-containing protein n=1 Tax=Stenotrophomonas sp. TaxID=69392 RepID=UPI002FC639EA
MHNAMRLALALACLGGALAGQAHAQVYKCTGKNGETVYAQNPCGAGAKEVQLGSTRAATRSSSEVATRQAVFRSTDLSDAAIAERNCTASARSNIYGPVDGRIAGYQRQVDALNQQLSAPRENLANATYDSGIRAQVASLQQSISAERQTAETSLNSSRQRCADQRREREAAIERKYQAEEEAQQAAAPAPPVKR